MSQNGESQGEVSQPSPPKISVVDLFCGAGGLSLGLQRSGIRVALGVDLDPACQHPFESGVASTFLQKDVLEVTGDEVNGFFLPGEMRLLAGCAPCQPFSRYTARVAARPTRWRLLREFSRIISEAKPDLVTLENVPGLMRQPSWASFVSGLEEEGFAVSWAVLNAADYGVPQSRKRLVLLGSRLGTIELPAPHGARATVRSAIGHLPPIAAGQRHGTDALHSARGLTEKNMARVRASRPAGSWKSWPVELRADCHRRPNGSTYVSVYGRMSWDEPSPTMTTQFYGFGNGRFGHPAQDRGLSLREGALLQSFPPGYEFQLPGVRVSARAVGRLIGNAVPPALAEAIGASIVAHVGRALGGAAAARYARPSR